MSGVHLRHWPGDQDRPGLALHCMMAGGSYWGPVAQALGGRLDLRGFDMPGHGRSDPWTPAAGDPDFHTAVTRIAASFIQRPLDLIGHSIGATVALRIAVAAPEAVRSLTLIEPVLFAAAPDAAQDARDAQMAELLERGDAEAAARSFLSIWGGPQPSALPPAVLDQIAIVRETGDTLRHDAARILRDGGLEAIDAPVMIVNGSDSPPVIHAITDALAARLPDVGRATVPGAGHMLPMTHPEQLAGLIEVNLERA
ncbi:alpha/beta fold hydrolase [Paracoccus sp. 1_MG-2023]|uniref:alpha/beta fold hydrolase n=1 Tax=unclassified Paracoccus (in: a-proteobacteria) TaxID=2688777 RepID=UPI001C0A6006|nr:MULTISPECIES: alpha/beta fold hydrolase [unclassified Paracoccus (in: a-proteobacteria)]MBU2958385.1 alpha/beta hydrolase [Paracoccus sp. C2R09]MDO6668630.1 alpha/beta fold hydrolase [Paracoccus sp. 1_MG-2023]